VIKKKKISDSFLREKKGLDDIVGAIPAAADIRGFGCETA
jgi:hypothetical protein